MSPSAPTTFRLRPDSFGNEVTAANARPAGDAAELLRVVRDEKPDLVIIDIRMPPTQETEGLDAAWRRMPNLTAG